MEEKELKTSTGQRVFIAIIAVVMLVTIIAGYAAIIISGNNGSSGNGQSSISEEKKMQYEEEYNMKLEEFKENTKSDFNKFVAYKGRIAAYNEANANDGGVKTEDIIVGDGRTLAEGDMDYMAYYVGWCADEKIFDSSFDNTVLPTGFKSVLTASSNLIEGWQSGVIGMKLNGIREVTIPSTLAYKEEEGACGANQPLKFMIMVKENTEPLKTWSAEIEEAYLRYQYAVQLGLDYDTVKNSGA